MIHYELQCSQSHSFDGWFLDSASFDRQAAHGLVECPVCGGTDVGRALMAPALARRATPPAAPERSVAQASEAPVAVAGERMPDHIRAALQRLRAEVEKTCDYVGPGFADEARRMHRGESEHRAIYGEATRDQAESLADEGIEIASIPWVPRSDG